MSVVVSILVPTSKLIVRVPSCGEFARWSQDLYWFRAKRLCFRSSAACPTPLMLKTRSKSYKQTREKERAHKSFIRVELELKVIEWSLANSWLSGRALASASCVLLLFVEPSVTYTLLSWVTVSIPWSNADSRTEIKIHMSINGNNSKKLKNKTFRHARERWTRCGPVVVSWPNVGIGFGR